MGDTSFPSFCILSKGNINYMTKMKDMKIWRVVFVMLATLILVSCSSDDEDYQIDQLAGTWLQVYDEGVVAEGYVKYTFTPGVPSTSGSCTIHVSDVFAGAKELPHIKQDGEKIIGYRMALTLPKLPESMVVMGSGAIGSEFAHFYSSLGTKVTIVEFLPNLVPVEDEEISKQLERCFRKNGVKVMTSSSVESVDTTGEKCKVTVKDAKGKITEIECDIVLSAVGVVTNIEGIGLEKLGIQTERGKVVVDEYYRTSCEGVYAIGDIVPGPALAHVASHEALVCVEKIAGLDPVPVD